jgi:hypothetical protein
MPFQWEPNTCDCILEVEFDGFGYALTGIVHKCAEHASVPDAQLIGVVFAVPAGENRRWTDLENELKTNASMDLGQITGDGSYEWKPGVWINWWWTGTDATRVLHFSVTGVSFSAQKKAAAQNWCNNKFGAGKVVVE